ncbi:51d7e4ec-40ae-41df-b443-966a146d6348 [Sclerotinia trifoliorum]|uniref:tryptophan--tRNA ligase n=1 Tax=Sclerotinia trifoliorum TaxID=28548 RepID=A0A8H2W417_9HELO|nr:51d7e4ec-40ae-41df-b443-966a146d6348 [Sclerotinia trifoliorum]
MAINYLSLVEKFGTQVTTPDDLKRFEQVTGHKPRRFMRRGIVFSHCELNLILDRHERGQPFFLYTRRRPSSDSMHIGHTIPFEFTKWLQDVFDVPLIIMLTDDEKYIFSEKKTIDEVRSYSIANCKYIITIGFNSKKNFIFSDYDFMGGAFYRNVTRISKHITLNVARAVSNIGKIHFGAVQGATSFASSFPHIFGTDEVISNSIPALIPCAIDQDPKMSASVAASAMFMHDEPSTIKNNIIRFAFSGGQLNEAEQREKGEDTDKDVSYQYLTFFLEDDEELEKIKKEYSSGEMLTGTLKAKCIAELQVYVKGFQERRAKVTDEIVADFMSQKPLVWGGNPNVTVVARKGENEKPSEEAAEGTIKLTKNQEKNLAKKKAVAEKKAAKKQ